MSELLRVTAFCVISNISVQRYKMFSINQNMHRFFLTNVAISGMEWCSGWRKTETKKTLRRIGALASLRSNPKYLFSAALFEGAHWPNCRFWAEKCHFNIKTGNITGKKPVKLPVSAVFFCRTFAARSYLNGEMKIFWPFLLAFQKETFNFVFLNNYTN